MCSLHRTVSLKGQLLTPLNHIAMPTDYPRHTIYLMLIKAKSSQILAFPLSSPAPLIQLSPALPGPIKSSTRITLSRLSLDNDMFSLMHMSNLAKLDSKFPIIGSLFLPIQTRQC
jgi:hypothetical protein